MLLKTKTAPDERRGRSDSGKEVHSTAPREHAKLSVRPTFLIGNQRVSSKPDKRSEPGARGL
jgi:hypothetical protein